MDKVERCPWGNWNEKGFGGLLSGGVPLSSLPSGGNGAKIFKSSISVASLVLRVGPDDE